MTQQTMPEGSADRKKVPVTTGVFDYFPAALAAVAKLSKYGNDKHNPGEPLHWARGKSDDHADCIGRHLLDRGIIDKDTGLSHTVEIAWRALALLQLEEEAKGAPVARGAWSDPAPVDITTVQKIERKPEERHWERVERRKATALAMNLSTNAICGVKNCAVCAVLDG